MTSSLYDLNLEAQRLKNTDFRNWGGAVPDDWSLTLGSVAKSDAFAGIQSARITDTGSTGVLEQAVDDAYVLAGKKIRLTCWVKCLSANARAAITTDADGLVYTSYHSGSGHWEMLSAEITITTSTSVDARLIVEGGVYADFDIVNLNLWSLDEGWNLDGDYITDVEIVSEMELYPVSGMYRAIEDREIVIESEFTALVDYIKNIDLLPLVPEKFHATEMDVENGIILLEDFIYQAGRYVGTWVSKVEDLQSLVDPYSVNLAYVDYLADLLNLQLLKTDETTLADLRNQLSQAVDYIKIKGTYESLTISAYLSGFKTNIYDMYTNDYTNFVLVPWFVGNEGENPDGLDSSYYKSPHFTFEIVADRSYGEGSEQYIWRAGMFATVIDAVEKTRPINTVPHYVLLINPVTIEDEEVYVTPEGIKTKCTSYWQQEELFLDMGSTSIAWTLDGGKFLDRPRTPFFDSIVKCKLGTGNVGGSPDETGFALQNVVLELDIEDYTVYSDRVDFEFKIESGVVVSGLTEFGLFTDWSTERMVVAGTMPSIDKISEVEMRFLVSVYFI